MGPSGRQAGSAISQVPPLQAEAHRSHEQAGAERANLSLPCPLTRLAMEVFACGTPVTCSHLWVSDNQVDFKPYHFIYLNNIFLFIYLTYQAVYPPSSPPVPLPTHSERDRPPMTKHGTYQFLYQHQTLARDNLSKD